MRRKIYNRKNEKSMKTFVLVSMIAAFSLLVAGYLYETNTKVELSNKMLVFNHK